MKSLSIVRPAYDRVKVSKIENKSNQRTRGKCRCRRAKRMTIPNFSSDIHRRTSSPLNYYVIRVETIIYALYNNIYSQGSSILIGRGPLIFFFFTKISRATLSTGSILLLYKKKCGQCYYISNIFN